MRLNLFIFSQQTWKERKNNIKIFSITKKVYNEKKAIALSVKNIKSGKILKYHIFSINIQFSIEKSIEIFKKFNCLKNMEKENTSLDFRLQKIEETWNKKLFFRRNKTQSLW